MSREITTDIEQKIDKAKKSLEQQRNRLQQLQARKTTQDRKQRTRKLILVGTVVVTKAEKDEAFRAELMSWLDKGITEQRNRVLFGLAQKPEGSDSGQSINGVQSSTAMGE